MQPNNIELTRFLWLSLWNLQMSCNGVADGEAMDPPCNLCLNCQRIAIQSRVHLHKISLPSWLQVYDCCKGSQTRSCFSKNSCTAILVLKAEFGKKDWSGNCMPIINFRLLLNLESAQEELRPLQNLGSGASACKHLQPVTVLPRKQWERHFHQI